MIDSTSLAAAGPPTPADLAAVLDWWREAGVDQAFADEPCGWLRAPEAESPAPPPPPSPPAPARRTPVERALAQPHSAPPLGGDRAQWPATLAQFPAWWLSEPTLTETAAAPRLAPRGDAGAQLMVLVDQPARDDGDTLLSGPAAKLLAAMLRAMAIPAEQAYLASALPNATALPDWSALAQRGLGDVTRHHIALAAPQRVLVLGRALAPLFGITLEAIRDPHQLDLGDRQVPLLLAADLAQLARMPARRRNFWIQWLEWTR